MDDEARTLPDPHEAIEPTEHRNFPRSEAFRSFIASGWAPRPDALPEEMASAPFAARRRERLAALFPGERLVFPAGGLKVRSFDTDYRFRPHSAFAHLTGLGTDREPDAVLVMEPAGEPGSGSHDAVLYVRPRAERDTEEFYADSRYGELWVGVRPSLAEVEAQTGIASRHLEELDEAITKDAGPGGVPVRVIRDGDDRLTERLDLARALHAGAGEATPHLPDAQLARAASELRLVKDGYEIEQMRLAVAASVRGFEDIVAALPMAGAAERGERVIEGVFELRAREEGNGVGYDTIAASGEHACTLHWIRNDGAVRDGDLMLIDAGVEVNSLYTADVTRTLPVNGRFSPAQRQVYQAVLEAADAAFAVARPGAVFRDLATAAMEVIARHLHAWGLLPGTVEESLDEQGQFHRRWMVHGIGHHLGIDVHDCGKARKAMYLDGTLRPGMIFTIEPGLYFGPNDLLAPAELRGIGVRIEDDVLLTETGCENLTAALPRTVDGVEAWMAELLER